VGILIRFRLVEQKQTKSTKVVWGAEQVLSNGGNRTPFGEFAGPA
jgi:hypothetical protein